MSRTLLILLLGTQIFVAQGCATTPPTPTAEPPAVEQVAEEIPQESTGLVVEVVFERELMTEPDADLPRTRLSLLMIAGVPPRQDRTRVTLEEVNSTCGERGYGGPSDPSEILFLQCWWGGQGMDYRVLQRGDTLVVERQYQAEEIGLGEEEPFEMIREIKLRPGERARAGSRAESESLAP